MDAIPLEGLKAGTVLNSHVYYDDYFIAIPKYHTITEEDIKMVKSYNLSPLYSSSEIQSIEESKIPKETQFLQEPAVIQESEIPQELKLRPNCPMC